MDAIKKKMQAMKLEKDNAMDRADACEQQAKDANLRAERVSGNYYSKSYSISYTQNYIDNHYFSRNISAIFTVSIL